MEKPIGTFYKDSEVVQNSPAPIGSFFKEDSIKIVDAVAQPDTILQSAGKDIAQGIGGLVGMASTGIKQAVDIVNPAIPIEQNTIYQIGKVVHDAIKEGRFWKEVGGTVKELVLPPIERAGEVVGQVASGNIPGAVETVARKPFTYAMDLSSILGMTKGAIATGGKAAKYGASGIFGPTTENIAARIANSRVVQEARPYEVIAKDIPSAMETLSQKIRVADDSAWATLSKDPAMGYTPEQIISLIDNTKKEIGKAVSDSDVNAVKALDTYKARIKKEWGDTNITQAETKSLIQSLSDDVDYQTAKTTASNTAIKNLRHNIDTVLKTDNEAYGMAMEPVRKLVRIQTDAQKALGVRYANGEYKIPDNTAKNISSLNKSFKEHEISILEDFADETGLNIPAESKNYAIQQHFGKQTTHGARRAVIGGTLGAAVGHATGSPTAGATLGAGIGGALDLWGGKALAAGIDATAPVINTIGKVGEKIPLETTATILTPKKEK